MKGKLLAGSFLAFSVLVATGAAAAVEFEVFRPVTPEEAAISLLPAETLSAAAGLGHTVRCSETVRRSADVELVWQSGGPTAGAQRVDVSKLRDGFELGRYEVSPRLAPGRASIGLSGPEPGIHYYWRVLTETPRGWAPSRLERFEAPVCPWDPPRLDLPGEGATPGGAAEGSGGALGGAV